jgi:hypothetical protein
MKQFTVNTHHAYLNNDIIFKCNGAISILDIVTGKEYQFTTELKTRLCAGKHIFVNTTAKEMFTGNNNEKKFLINEYNIDEYKAKFNTDKLKIVENPNKSGSFFFSCGMLQNGRTNYGAVGQKAKAILDDTSLSYEECAKKLQVSIYKVYNEKGQAILLPILQAKTNTNFIVNSVEDQEEMVFIEDAIKLGGSRLKNAFVFDKNPWIFVTTMDRLYITNKETKEEKVEYNITPNSIKELGFTNDYVYDSEEGQFRWIKKPCEYFLFQTENDYAIYDVLRGNIVFSFINHIYSNEHLVIYKKDNGFEIYDYREEKTIEYFDGQYSFGSKFYYVKDRKLYGLNLSTSYINEIDFVGEIGDEYSLTDNYLFELEKDGANKKQYACFWLGNGERNMSKTVVVSPYYVENWKGNDLASFQKVKDLYSKFKVENSALLSAYSSINTLCIGLRITRTLYEWENKKRLITLYGEIITFPALKHTIPFKLKGFEEDTLDFNNAIIEPTPPLQKTTEKKEEESVITNILNEGEIVIGKSSSGNLLVLKVDNKLFLHNVENNTHDEILHDSFDSSSYSNAYFTSDGKDIVLQINNNEAKILGIEDLKVTHFEVDGFTVARNEGFNGYKPEIALIDGRKPVWRDPISLSRIQEKDMSKHVFMSPDGNFTADTNLKIVYYNRLENKEISIDELCKEKNRYDWKKETSDREKKDKIEMRRELIKRYGRDLLFDHLISLGWEEQETNNLINYYLEQSDTFTPVFIDELGFVCYHKNQSDEKRILIGRSVWFLNYVSFSYDSKYLAFGAKMKKDEFRFSEEGVFVLFDLEKREVIMRQEKELSPDEKYQHSLCAVWMTMFNKKGDVTYYDSNPNAYMVSAESQYKDVKEALGKSLLCFSTSGNYIAFSDQSYIDYAHHPNSFWGHQPSGNVYIHSTEDFEQCIEHYNDLGEGIEGVASRAGSVSSAAFSQDEKRLLVVGNDGVVVVRNLKLAKAND